MFQESGIFSMVVLLTSSPIHNRCDCSEFLIDLLPMQYAGARKLLEPETKKHVLLWNTKQRAITTPYRGISIQ
jgi:hypothetical protein